MPWRSGLPVVAALFGTAAAAVFFGCSHPQAPAAGPARAPRVSRNPKADNTPCYVCHLTLKDEEITTTHLAVGLGCSECHGPSNDHMHDEMLMTPADIKYGRTEVEGLCGYCHAEPHVRVGEKVKAFLATWRGRDRPNGRVITESSVCTDCHGTHNIVKEMGSKEEKKPAEWIPAFNGKDLSGWTVSGGDWQVKRRRLVGGRGADGAGGTIWTAAEYGDVLLSVTFRSDWPSRAGILLRGTGGKPGARIEISRKLGEGTGSVTLPGRGAVLANLRDDLFDPEGWNTVSAEVVGRRIRVWLNGEEVGTVRVPLPARGRIGLELVGGKDYAGAGLSVREVQVQPVKVDKAKEE
jgi:hypothetical protein